MDCQMPLLDGYETTRRLREREKEAGDDRVPVIALTANTMSGDRDRCMEAGMDDFIGKPIRAGELVEKLERWLGRPSQA
jgi:CheY-like chemotaxis protein